MQTGRSVSLAAAMACAVPALVAPTGAQAGASGNVGIVSQYIFRGGVENDDASVHGGFGWAGAGGFYAGYWGGALGYSDEPSANGVENNYYAGYAGSAGPVSYDLGVLYYHFLNVDDADAFEITASIGLGPLSVGASYLTEDVVWGNKGDVYWTLSWDAALPMDFAFNATAGYYSWEGRGDYIPASAKSSGFRHLDITLAHPAGDTGADVHVTYTVGGKDRNDNDLDDALVLGISYAFDL